MASVQARPLGEVQSPSNSHKMGISGNGESGGPIVCDGKKAGHNGHFWHTAPWTGRAQANTSVFDFPEQHGACSHATVQGRPRVAFVRPRVHVAENSAHSLRARGL